MPTDRPRDAAPPDYGSLADRQEDASDATERERSEVEFHRRDRDGDGGLTAEEYVGAAEGGQVGRRLRDFLKADADGDGQITIAEWHRLRGTALAGDQLIEVGDLLRKAEPEVGDALYKVLTELPAEVLTHVAQRIDVAAVVASADQAGRTVAIVRAIRAGLESEMAGHLEAAAAIDGWLGRMG